MKKLLSRSFPVSSSPAFRSSRLALLAGSVMLLSACGHVGPDYTPPTFDLTAAYSPIVPVIAAKKAQNGRWWDSTDDALLRKLIAEGLANNIDLKSAASRVAEARAVERGVKGGNGPEVNGSADGGAQRSWDSSKDGTYKDSLNGGASLGISWKPDLWGGQYRQSQKAGADVLKQVYLREDIYRTVIADIIRNYVQLRGDQQRQILLRDSLDLQRQTRDIVQLRSQTGLASELDLSRSQAEVADIEATLPALQTSIDRSINAIDILIGAQPGTLRDELAKAEPLPSFDSSPAIGIPADLLRRRPDLRAAELNLISATAEIGVRTADLYPELTLDGTLSMAGSGFGSGTIVRTALAAISATIDATIYDGGVRQANIDVAREQAHQAFLDYRKTLLGAIDEVESAIFGYVGALQQVDSLTTSVNHHRDAFVQSRVRYVQGLSNFLDVLDAQRSLTSSQQQLADAKTQLEIETVNLYAAVGFDAGEVDRLAAQMNRDRPKAVSASASGS